MMPFTYYETPTEQLRIYNIPCWCPRWGEVSPDFDWSIPMIDADFLRFTSKIVEHSRYLPLSESTDGKCPTKWFCLPFGDRGCV
jgi:hypothetical protein